MSKVPMTKRGRSLLEKELKQLKSVERPSVIQAIAEARAHGDLSENAEYDAAKEKQGFVEGRIKDIEDKIARSEVIDPSELDHDRVVFGATVKLLNMETDEEKTYSIVGVDEADAKKGMVSIESPIARQLLNRHVGDEVTIKVPKGEVEYEILDIRYK